MSSYTEYHKRYYETKVKGKKPEKKLEAERKLAQVCHIIECLQTNDPTKWDSCRLQILDKLYVEQHKLQCKVDSLS